MDITQIRKLKTQVDEKTAALLKKEADKEALQKQSGEFAQAVGDLQRKQDLRHLLDRVHPEAQKRLLTAPDFRDSFEQGGPHATYIMSIDIRRSTDLMLKARAPSAFAAFVTQLADQLREAILENFGIFDKFTGDGILAFFPEFYSGVDAGFYVLSAAERCHRIFHRHYESNRNCFDAIFLDTGLGIGIDFGLAEIVRISDDLTVVGRPVVYACRMGGATAGSTYVNQPAYETLFERYSASYSFEPREITFKHEGRMLAYSVNSSGKPYVAAKPTWMNSESAQPEVTQTREPADESKKSAS